MEVRRGSAGYPGEFIGKHEAPALWIQGKNFHRFFTQSRAWASKRKDPEPFQRSPRTAARPQRSPRQ